MKSPAERPILVIYTPGEDHGYLMLEGTGTAEGLRMFPPDAPVGVAGAYFFNSGEPDPLRPQEQTAAGVAAWLDRAAEGLFFLHNFESKVGGGRAAGGADVSSHDDCELHVKAAPEECRRVLLLADPVRGAELWEMARTLPGRYMAAPEAGPVRVFETFDEWLDGDFRENP